VLGGWVEKKDRYTMRLMVASDHSLMVWYFLYPLFILFVKFTLSVVCKLSL
jgi:hypothetical protein